jgi:hypothetical protein
VSPPGVGKHAGLEIKEWQAIMDHLSKLPVKTKGELPLCVSGQDDLRVRDHVLEAIVETCSECQI